MALLEEVEVSHQLLQCGEHTVVKKGFLVTWCVEIEQREQLDNEKRREARRTGESYSGLSEDSYSFD